jgi:hypothetical protein
LNKLLVIFSLLGVFIFSAALSFTVTNREQVKEYSRDYINSRIEPSVTTNVSLLKDKYLNKLKLVPRLFDITTREVTRYDKDPIFYINEITSGNRKYSMPEGVSKLPKFLQGSVAKSVAIGNAVKDHFKRVFDNIIIDLQVFCLTNIIGFLLVLALILFGKVKDNRVYIPAFILFTAIGYGMFSYVDQSWFFNILLDSHMGIWYPLLIISTSVWLWYKWKKGELRSSVEELIEDVIL